ncbi:MAG: glucose 1-dehydrogenase [Caulobacterales bacterium]
MSVSADLSNKRALITGASSGLGKHFARVLAKAGAHVVLAARRLPILEKSVKEIEADGGKASCVTLDVTDPDSISAAIAAAGPIDILINNAGVTDTKALLSRSAEDFDAILNANLRGAYLVALEAAKAMQTCGASGSIINVASILGLRQGGGVTPYAISKAGVIQMTKQFALELARFNIRVNALAPGYIATELNEDFFETDAGAALIKRIPQRRLGSLSDLDGPLLLLASNASAYITGSIIEVDGGHLVSGL